MKLTQQDLCVLYLAERVECRVCEMAGNIIRGQMLGSQSDKRMYEVIEDIALKGFYEVEGIRYVIEPGKEGKFKTYRVVSGTPKPKQVMTQMFTPDGRPYMLQTFI